MSWSASSPANIALIKYMGKVTSPFPEETYIPLKNLTSHLSEKDETDLMFRNLNLNPSLSYILNHFVTKVLIEKSYFNEDKFFFFKNNPFEGKPLYHSNKELSFTHELSSTAQQKYLDFFKFLKRVFQIQGNYIIFSQNNFPSDIGAASSASSVSALTQAVYKLALTHSPLKESLKNMSPVHLANLSRVGSGSSCRSFFSPWCFWDKYMVRNFKCPWKKLHHQLVVFDLKAKQTSSSSAHAAVKSSKPFKGRPERAKKRLELLSKALHSKDWKSCFEISYEEFLDMHSLFESSSPQLQYQTKESKEALKQIKNFWKKKGDGPLVTMDAGASIHLLYRHDQKKLKKQLAELFSDYIVLSSL